MKKTLVIISLIIVVSFIIVMSISIFANYKGDWFHKEEVSDAYVFPITPNGTPDEWRELKDNDEKVSACQIPEETLKKMSTRGLIETCFNYPLFSNFAFFDSPVYGIEDMNNYFNGSRELLERSDAASELLSYYKDIDFESAISSNDPYYPVRIVFINYFISQEKILLNMSNSERFELLNACKSYILEINNKYADMFPIDSHLYLATCILQLEDASFNSEIIKSEDLQFAVSQGHITEQLAQLVFSYLGIGA